MSGHGNWLPWLKANAEVLGFENDRTAQKLMNASRKSAVDGGFDDITPGRGD